MNDPIRPLRRTSLCTAFLVIIAGALGARAQDPAPDVTTTPTGTPRMSIEESDHNYGRILKGDVVEHLFIVRNDGDAPLLIEKVQAT